MRPSSRDTKRPETAVITGSGMEGSFDPSEKRTLKTHYGLVDAYLCHAGKRAFLLIPRHGRDHSIPPHRINFKANIQALKDAGIRDVFATSAVGSISKKVGIGELGLLDQFIDFGKRHVTFFERKPVHVDMTRPYSGPLKTKLTKAAKSLGIKLTPGLVYACMDGPRYETAAEIGMFRLVGADVVGMTGAPEAILANEAGLRYASLVVATNWAAGIQEKVSHEEVVSVMTKTAPRVKELLQRAIGY